MEERETSAVLSENGEGEVEWDGEAMAEDKLTQGSEEGSQKQEEEVVEGDEGDGVEGREAEEESVAIAYDDIDHYQESEQEQDQEFEDDFEDDFEEEESEGEVLPQEQEQKQASPATKSKPESEDEKDAGGNPEKEEEEEEEEPAAQSFETQTESDLREPEPEPEPEVLQREGVEEREDDKVEDSIGTSPMEFPSETERLEGDLPKEETDFSEETKALTEMTFKPPVPPVEQEQTHVDKPMKASSPEREPELVKAEQKVTNLSEPAAMTRAPSPPPRQREEVVEITSNPIRNLLEREEEREKEDPMQNAAAAEQYKQYEQYQAGLELERQLEKLDMQRKTSMEHISRDLFNATTKQSNSNEDSGLGGGDLAANVDTSYVSVPTIERAQPARREWMMPEVKEKENVQHQSSGSRDALETDLDKDLRNRLNMTELERDHYTKENQAPQQHGATKLGKIASTRTYLESTVVPVLREAMKDLARKRPENPFDFLIEYLQRNRPSH